MWILRAALADLLGDCWTRTRTSASGRVPVWFVCLSFSLQWTVSNAFPRPQALAELLAKVPALDADRRIRPCACAPRS